MQSFFRKLSRVFIVKSILFAYHKYSIKKQQNYFSDGSPKKDKVMATSKLQNSLNTAAKNLKYSAIIQGSLSWWIISGTIVFLLVLIDNLLHLPSGIRLAFGCSSAFIISSVLFKKTLWKIVKPYPKKDMALLLEKRYQIPQNFLINAFQFSRKGLDGNEEYFVKRTIQEAEKQIKTISLSALWEFPKIYKYTYKAGLIAILYIVYISIFPRYFANAWQRYTRPLADIPPVTSFILQVEPSQNKTIEEGDHLVVSLTIQSEGKKELKEIPLLVRQNVSYMPPIPEGEKCNMQKKEKNQFTYTFSKISSSFSFRIFAANTYTKSIYIDVKPYPNIQSSLFCIQNPSYIGGKINTIPGPPAKASVISGSKIKILLQTDQPIQKMILDEKQYFQYSSPYWETQIQVKKLRPYEIKAITQTGKKISLTKGEISLKLDKLPKISFITDDYNRLAHPGEKILLQIKAQDDYGVKEIQLTSALSGQSKKPKILTVWRYTGPGPKKTKENFELQLNTENFKPGKVYILQAICKDFSPINSESKSQPMLIRIKSISELDISRKDHLKKAFDLLRRTLAEQKKANSTSENFRVYFLEALKENTVLNHQLSLLQRQRVAQKIGYWAISHFKRHPQGKSYASTLQNLIQQEMGWVLKDIEKIRTAKAAEISKILPQIEKRQDYILNQLISLLGEIAKKKEKSTSKDEKTEDKEEAPEVSTKDAVKKLRDALKDFIHAQRKIVDRSKTLADKGPEDLTDKEQKILGELAREEAKWAKFLEEKLTDFSKLPQQDFADGSMADEFNQVYQEIQLAAKKLYEKKVEIAVPHEQSGLEKAEELVHNLEKWLPDTPDYQKWVMEEPKNQADIPLAELPDELEDIVGELVDQEENMTEDVEDVSSSWMDSLDKGAGWDAKDGPISNMSAKGVTSNQLPNKSEIGGRSGEGRTGRSHGQMVEKTAEGKKGRSTPSRLTPSPFEQGSVKDTSKQDTSGSTGGGKMSGFTGEGLRGPVPPALKQKMARLAGQQRTIRQKAERLNARLKAYRMPTGDLQRAIRQMKRFEKTANRGYGPNIRRSFRNIVHSMRNARKSLQIEAKLRRERIKLPSHMRKQIMTGIQDGIPKGYEEMITRYFRALAEEKIK